VGASAEETHEAVAGGQGIALLCGGNAPLVVRDEVIAVPVRGVSPAQLAVAARRDDERPMVPAFPAAAAKAGAAASSASG
jgi:hypothetical protein